MRSTTNTIQLTTKVEKMLARTATEMSEEAGESILPSDLVNDILDNILVQAERGDIHLTYQPSRIRIEKA